MNLTFSPTASAYDPALDAVRVLALDGQRLVRRVVMRDDLPDAGLANVTATYLNLLGLQEPSIYAPSLITTAGAA